MLNRRVIALAAIAGSALPTEFRLFTAGWNDTENGRYLFDEEAAAATMAAYEKWGVDLAIDLEHQMLEPEIAPDPTAKDARGWCKLELRPDGSLWATSVSWTADGAARLTEKRQRYVSPAFSVDPETSRVTAIVNVAITAIPATHDTPALVAASRAAAAASVATNMQPTAKLAAAGENAMTLEEFQKVCKALGLDPTMSLEDAMAKIKGEGPAAGADDAPPSSAQGGPPDSSIGQPEAAAAAPPPPAPAADDKDKEDKETVAASIARLTRLTGKPTIAASVEEVELWRKSHVEIEERTAKLAKEQAALELGRRKENAKKLVELGAETPHTCGLATFVKDGKAVNGKLAKRLLDEPLDEQTARVTALLAAKGGKLPTLPTPPAATNGGAPVVGAQDVTIASGETVTLSAREVERCQRKKLDLVAYATNRAAIAARSAPTTNTGADR